MDVYYAGTLRILTPLLPNCAAWGSKPGLRSISEERGKSVWSWREKSNHSG